MFYLIGVLCRFQHCTGHITTGSWKGRGNKYIQFVRVLYCKLPTNGKPLPAFTLEVVPATEPRPQRWEARVLPLCHRWPHLGLMSLSTHCISYTTMGRFYGSRKPMHTSWSRFCNINCRALVNNYQVSNLGSGLGSNHQPRR